MNNGTLSKKQAPTLGFVSGSVGTLHGGTETYLLTATKELSNSLSVKIATGNGDLSPEFTQTVRQDNISYLLYPFLNRYSWLLSSFHIPKIKPFDIEALCALYSIRKIKKFFQDVDILEVHYPVEGLLFPFFKPEIKKILHLHGPWLPPLYKGFKHLINKNCDLILTCSEYSKFELNKILPEMRIEVIYNGVDTVKFKPGKQNSFSPDFDYNQKAFKVGTVARLSHNKGIHLLAQAAQALEGDVEFFIAGPIDPDFIEELEQYKNQTNFHLIGSIPHNQVPEFYNFLDCFILPSYLEALSISTIEAMACGLPVVVTKTGGLVEVVDEFDSGLFVPVGDVGAIVKTLQQLSSNKFLQKSLGVTARKRIETYFGLEKTISQAGILYAELGKFS